MPLDLELVRPSDPTSNNEDDMSLDAVSKFILEEDMKMLAYMRNLDVSVSSQQESQNENYDINIETSVNSLSLESNNLNCEDNEKNVDNSSTMNVQDEEERNEEEKEEAKEKNEEENNEESSNKNFEVEDEDIVLSSRTPDNKLGHEMFPRGPFLHPSEFARTEFNVPVKTSKLKNSDETVPQFLISCFVSMVDPSPLADIGTEIHHQCAFYFPAVVMTLGRKNWFQLKNAYQALAADVQWKVRCTLASSIHEIALILGEELTGTDLMPIYDGFIKDLDEVRIGALKHLSTFLKVLRPSNRQQYLSKLADFIVPDNECNWRFREEFANQLLQAIPLYKPEDISKHIAPLALQLLQDKVAAVRQIALALVRFFQMLIHSFFSTILHIFVFLLFLR